MQTATRPAKVRTLRLTRTPGGLALVIREQVEGGTVRVEAYYLTVLPGAVRFTKTDGTVYTVSGAGASCDCPARHHGDKVVCRHRSAVRTLTELGRLPAPACEICGGRGGSAFGDADADGLCRGCGE